MIGLQEVILILVILLLIVGPKKLPEIAKQLGSAVREFKRTSSSMVEIADSALKTEEGEDIETLLEIARKLDIYGEGKSTKQLINEIMTKIDKKEKG